MGRVAYNVAVRDAGVLPGCNFAALERQADAALAEARQSLDSSYAKERNNEALSLISGAIRAAIDQGERETELRFIRLLVHAHMCRIRR